MNRISTQALFVFAVSFALVGCTSYKEVAPVKGKVTFGGEPVAGITVVLQPAVGRASLGRTTEDGSFEMVYTLQEWGAKVGASKVWFDPFSADPVDDPDLCAPSPLIGKIPGEYFSFIQDFQVEPKVNTLNIDIPKP